MSTSLVRPRVAAVAFAVAAAGLLPGMANAQESTAAGTTHYLDCGGGDDSASGTGSDRAWRSLARAGGHVFGPGDRLLLKRGTRCTGVLTPKGAGAEGAPVRIDAYGRGAKPHIEGGGARAAVHLINTEQWEIRNLDLSTRGPRRPRTAARACWSS